MEISSLSVTKTLVLYVFHQINDRVQSFINKAIFQAEDVDFIVIANDKTLQFEVPDYVKKFQRDNIGYDFGGWSDALLTNDLYKDYDSFIFVNSSVIGPFIKSGRWTDVFLNAITENIKLVGSTINTCKKWADPQTYAHVQSYIFAMKRDTLDYLISAELFSNTNYPKTFLDTIYQKEIKMSRLLIHKGWNIGSLSKYYQGVDFTTDISKWKVFPFDDYMLNEYYGIIWNEYDLVFIKGNRINIAMQQ